MTISLLHSFNSKLFFEGKVISSEDFFFSKTNNFPWKKITFPSKVSIQGFIQRFSPKEKWLLSNLKLVLRRKNGQIFLFLKKRTFPSNQVSFISIEISFLLTKNIFHWKNIFIFEKNFEWMQQTACHTGKAGRGPLAERWTLFLAPSFSFTPHEGLQWNTLTCQIIIFNDIL